MSSVEEFFPGVPEKCENCPGLTWAANWLNCAYDLAVMSATEGDNSDNPLNAQSQTPDPTMPTAIARYFSESATSDTQAIEPVAQSLWEACPFGVQEVEESRGRFRKPAITRLCGSQAILAHFIPPKRKGE